MSRHHTHLNRRRWQAVRLAVFERDGWRCVVCGKAGHLEADHVVPLETDPDQDPYDVAGLQTLCRSCHGRKTVSERPGYDPELERHRRAWRALILDLAAE